MEENRPIYTLTVEEFKELSKTIAIENSYLNQPSKQKEKEPNDIIFIGEAVTLTGYKESTIYTKVCRREMPVISFGRPLTFSRKQLNEWMKSGRPTVAEMIADDFNSKPRKGR